MKRGAFECFLVSLRLGLTSFGGPVAHVGYFRDVYVKQKKWLVEDRFAELMALTQFLPGPGSSQLGAAIGYEKAGWLGGFLAWLGFTLPSAILMILFAIGVSSFEVPSGSLAGLQLMAVAVVFVAFLGMRRSLCPRLPEILIGGLAFGALVVLPVAWFQPVVIFLGALVGAFVFKNDIKSEHGELGEAVQRKTFLKPAVALVFMVVGLIALSLGSSEGVWQSISGLINAGSLVFGGGHVVLPLLELNTVDTGLVSQEDFLAGYGAAQAVPGPLFTFAAFLGANMGLFQNMWIGGFVALCCLFLPGMALLAIALPVWNNLRGVRLVRSGVRGANASVVGVLGAALLGMLTNGGVQGAFSWLILLVFIVAIIRKWLPVWSLVCLSAVGGYFFI